MKDRRLAYQPVTTIIQNYIIILMSFIPSIQVSFVAAVLTSMPLFLTVLPERAYSADRYHVEVDKTRRTLTLSNAAGRVVKEFKVALGRGGLGHKKARGDGITPLGSYIVVGFNEKSDFHYFIRLNYPNNNDALAAYRNNTITFVQLQKILHDNVSGETPLQNTVLGGAIGLHGIGDETDEKLLMHSRLDWTQGCIALKNDEIEQLRPFLTLGVHVVIKE
jgi:murein L,D-transpeptidase YafK